MLVVSIAGAWVWTSTIGTIHRDTDVVAELAPEPGSPDDPVNVLVVGSDSRERIREDAGDRFGPVHTTAGERADVIMLVRFSARDRDVRVLSVPRDVQLDVDGFGPQKISTTLGLGGSRLLVGATKKLTGLPVHHYVELDFVGFARIVDSVGGVPIDFPAPGRDVMSGLDVEAGSQRLDGDAALALVRSRSYEEWRDGAWVAIDDGDGDRIGRQHQFLRAIAGATAGGSILDRVRLLAEVGAHVTVDSRLSLHDMARLADRASAIGRDGHEFQTLPTEPVLTYEERVSAFPPLHVGAVAYERLAQPAAAAAISSFTSSPAWQS